MSKVKKVRGLKVTNYWYTLCKEERLQGCFRKFGPNVFLFCRDIMDGDEEGEGRDGQGTGRGMRRGGGEKSKEGGKGEN